MRFLGRGLAAGLVLGFVMVHAENARAQDPSLAEAPPKPVDAPAADVPSTHALQQVDWSLTGKGGFLSPPIRGGTTPFGAGLGGAFGLTVSNLYIAASIVYFLGGTDVTISDHALFYGLEVGYAFKLMPIANGELVLRPQLGGGGVTIYHTDPSTAKVDVVSSASGGSSSSSTSDTTSVDAYYIQPSVTLMYEAKRYLVGVNGNSVILPGITYGGGDATTWIAYGLEAQVGVRF